MDVICRDEGAVRAVGLSGVLDAAAAGAVRKRLLQIVEQGARRIVLDMGGVERIDSSGLGALVTTLKALRERDGDMVLSDLPPGVRAVVELTRLHRVFEIYDDRELALQELLR